MNKSMGMYVIGVVLILGAAMLFMLVVNQATEKSISFHLSPNGIENRTVYMRGNASYAIVFTSKGNISYAIYSPHASKMEEGYVNGSKTILLNTTEDGKHIISVRNMGGEDVDVTVIVMDENDLGGIVAKELGVFLMCVIGIVVVLAGIITNIRARR